MSVVLSILTLAAAIAVPLFVYWRQRRKKDLAYELSSATLGSVHSKARDRVRVVFEGRPIERVALTTLIVRNAGSEPILARDFALPISVSFSDREALLDHYIGECHPADLSPSIVETSRGLVVSPLLLNPGDRFEVLLLVDAARHVEPMVTARIVGIPQLTRSPSAAERAERSRRQLRRVSAAATTVLALAGALISVLLARGPESGPEPQIRALPGSKTVTIYNKVTSGPREMREDAPLRLSVSPRLCYAGGCVFDRPIYRTGDRVHGASCATPSATA